MVTMEITPGNMRNDAECGIRQMFFVMTGLLQRSRFPLNNLQKQDRCG